MGTERPIAGPGDVLLARGVRGISLGVERLGDTLRLADPDAIVVDWRPPGTSVASARALARLSEPAVAARIEAANSLFVERLLSASPRLVDVRPARDLVPILRDRVLLHAGPPLEWDRMTGPMRGAAIGAAIFEGWTSDSVSAQDLLDRGEVRFVACHDVGCVGPMGGITSGSMPLLVVAEQSTGGRALGSLNEGIGRVLRFGANGPDVIERLHWLQDQAGPLIGEALRSMGGVDLRPIMARALSMGDEMHQRNVAATALLLREIAPSLDAADASNKARGDVLRYLGQTDQFFLNVAMAACKAIADAAAAVGKDSSLVTVMSRNGVEFGIRLGATGVRWFTAPVNVPRGLFFGGYSAEDANPDIGDSAITETVGIGAFCMAAAPGVAPYVGLGGFEVARQVTTEMFEITAAQNPDFAIPTMDFAGAPTGIDVRKVVATGIEPIINTGIAHRNPGIGQIGAGTVRAPLRCFEQALLALDAMFQ